MPPTEQRHIMPVAAAEHKACLEKLQSNLDATPEVAQRLSKGGETLDDACLRRWLRADNYSLPKVEARLRTHAKWRHDYVPNGRIDESEVPREEAMQKAFLPGSNKLGQPTIFVLGRNHDANGRDLEECKRYMCYCLDRAIERANLSLNPDGQVCVIFDLRGLAMKNLDRGVLMAVFDTLRNHYPETIGSLWFFDAPTIFWGLWKVVSPFVDPETSKKVKFVNAKAPQELVSLFDPKELPKDLGGTAELVSMKAAALSYLQQQQGNCAPPAKPDVNTNGAAVAANGTQP